jgi:thiamine-phosphate pyrophosphorylase
LPAGKARQFLGMNSIIGYSTHSTEQALQAGRLPVDYVAIGPVFETGTKKNPDPVVGLAAISEVRKLTSRPLVGIGGITLETAPEVLQAGADAVAVISDLLLAEDIKFRACQFLSALR